jgi:voltage-gated potassium channel
VAAGGIEMSEEQTEQPAEAPTSAWGMYSTQIITSVIAAVLGLGTVVYHLLEGWGWIDSFYFSVITLTSVGYGDLAPTSPESKLFTTVYIVTGISLLGAALNEVMKRRGRHRASKYAQRTR